MSDIVSSVLKHTFGFVANKIRKEIAERLTDGDVTDEECRRLIVRELDDIKSKLDGLARKDLLSSVCFLKEGINGLYQLQLELHSDENTVESTEGVTLVEASSSRNIGPDPSSSMNEAVALVSAVTSLKLHSNEHIKSAIESFKLAREKATEAFCNEALSIEDRIQASQIRVMARILEKLEHPDASVRNCLQYLQELHDVGAIREIFSVLINGGLKSRFNRTKRVNSASSVQDMNVMLFNFARKFTKLSLGIFDWPTISAGEEIYNPVFGAKRDALVGKLERSGGQLTSPRPDFTFDRELSPRQSVVNSKEEIVARFRMADFITIFKRSGESRPVCELSMEEEHATEFYVKAITIDAEDNIYVITTLRESDEHGWSFKLFIFDDNGNKKLETLLSFYQSLNFPKFCLAISKERRIATLNDEDKILHIGKACVEINWFKIEKRFHLKQLETDSVRYINLKITDANGTKIMVNGRRTVYIYDAENGQLQREIKTPDKHGFITSLEINHKTKCILVKTYHSLFGKTSLLSFSETGELVHSLRVDCTQWDENTNLTSHPNGTVVLVGEREAMIIKGQQK